MVDTINGVYQTCKEMDPKVCILGYLEKERYSMEVKIPINRLLFIARKIISLKWVSSGAPTYEEWRLEVNDALLKERQLYQSRSLLDKFQKMCEP